MPCSFSESEIISDVSSEARLWKQKFKEKISDCKKKDAALQSLQDAINLKDEHILHLSNELVSEKRKG